MRATEALYVISVAARSVGLHPTTLRKYERVGFLEPSRTPGRTRLYSQQDLRRLRQIKTLVEDREVNLAGVQLALFVAERLRTIATLVDQAQDLETLKRDVRRPLLEAFAAVGATE
jgi:MerR family transcriptional regulator, heat shock protein HspR